MEDLVRLAQLIVSLSVIIVWVFRYDNIIIEFKQFRISDLLRNIVGASKISLATILLLGICYKNMPLTEAAIGMAFFMVCAQIAHVKVKNPWIKYVPSFILLFLSLFIAAFNYGVI